MSLLNRCQPELHKFLNELTEFVRLRSAEIKTEHRERWRVVRDSGGRQFDLRNEVLPDYSFFLMNNEAEIIGMESFKKLFLRIQTDQQISAALKLNGISPGSFFIYYAIPIETTILTREDENKDWEAAQSFVLSQLDQFLMKDTYTARVSATLKNFRSEVVDVELAEGVFLRSVDDTTMEAHINSVSFVTGHSGVVHLREINYQFEAVWPVLT